LELLSGSCSTTAESVSAVEAGTPLSWSGTERLEVAIMGFVKGRREVVSVCSSREMGWMVEQLSGDGQQTAGDAEKVDREAAS
jgi:hypothetical protein